MTGQLPASLQLWTQNKSTEVQPSENTKSPHCEHTRYSHSTCLQLVNVFRGAKLLQCIKYNTKARVK